MLNKFLALLLLSCLFVPAGFTTDLNLEDVIANVQANQAKVKDMYAETTTTITSNIQIQKSKSQTMVQKGRIWTKGTDKTKTEILSPVRQITINNGEKAVVINPETGERVQGQGAGGQGAMDLEKAKDYFNLSIKRLATRDPRQSDEYIISGIPKKENNFLGKMEFYVDSIRGVTTKVLMYTGTGKLMNETGMEYVRVQGEEDIWVVEKTHSSVITPAGKMSVEMVYENIKVNQGIEDEEFGI